MAALGKEARRMLALAKGSHEPPAWAKAHMRKRLDSKLAASAILGVTGLASKTTFAQLLLPVGKAVFVSFVLAGAASVGYVAAPTMWEPAASVSLPRTAKAGPARVAKSSATELGTDLGQDSETNPETEPAMAIGSAVLAPLEQAPAIEPQRELASPPQRESLRVRQVLTSDARNRVYGAPLPTSERERRAAQTETVPKSEPDGSAAKPTPLGEREGSQLGDETRLIRQAHQAILRGEPTVALELLAAHQRRFASGVLVQEREAARIVATCKLGRMQEAQLQWTRFTAIWPGSPLIDSVRSSCHW